MSNKRNYWLHRISHCGYLSHPLLEPHGLLSIGFSDLSEKVKQSCNEKNFCGNIKHSDWGSGASFKESGKNLSLIYTMTNQRIFRSYKEPIRGKISWRERWQGYDKGLISCWEVGRELREKKPELSKLAKKGELPILGFKGGVRKKIK